MKVAVGQKAGDIELYDLHGDTVMLSSLFAKSPVVLFFHRHIGSIFTKQAFRRLDCSVEQLEAHKVRFVSIVPTDPSRACDFYAKGDYWHYCLADPSMNSYRTYGIASVTPINMFSAVGSVIKAAKKGYRMSSILSRGALVVPTAVLIDNKGVVRAIRCGKNVGDIPDVNEMIRFVAQADQN